MRVILPVLFFFCLNSCIGIKPKEAGKSTPIDHQIWNSLLQNNVHNGRVDYKAFIRDSSKLNRYLSLVSDNHPNLENWTESERLAYWINAYNAFTVKLIVNHYPINSIKDITWGVPFINSVWDVEFIEIEACKYDLNDIEHGILRSQFKEPRIHFAINCASNSCPVLRQEAYLAEKIEFQLEEQTRLFINDTSKNVLGENTLQISKIFRWFGSDFEIDGASKIEFIKPYTTTPIALDAELDYLDYDWSLNE